MPPQPYSPSANLDLTLRDLRGEDVDACRFGELVRKPSLTHGSSEVQHKNPFVDEYALHESGYDQDVIITTERDTKTTMILRSLGLPVTDDGLPDSVPSRHTLSDNSSRPISRRIRAAPFSADSRHRPPPLPLSPRNITTQQPLSSPFQGFIPGYGEDLVTPRASPQRQTTFVDAAVGDRSEAASIHGAGEHAQIIGESERAVGAPKRLSVKSPNGYAGRSMSYVRGQKQPFPLLSPVLAQASEPSALDEKQNQSHERFKRGPQIIKQRKCVRMKLWRKKSKWIGPSLKAIFVISIITLTAAVVTGVKDAKVDVLEAGTVIAGIIGFVGSTASVLCAWAISRGSRYDKKVNKLYPEEDVNPEEITHASNEKKERASQFSKQIRPNLGHFSVASGERKQWTEDVERSPRFEQTNPINDQPLASLLLGQHLTNGAHASEFGLRLSIPIPTHSSSSGIPIPSSEALPATPSRRHSEPTLQSQVDHDYRELLESRLASRDIWDVLDEAAAIDEVYGEQHSPDGAPRNELQKHTAQGTTDKSPEPRQTEGQILPTRNLGTSMQQSILATTRSPSSIPSVLPPGTAHSLRNHTQSPFGQIVPSFPSYPPLSLSTSSEPSIDQIQPASPTHPAPVYQQPEVERSADSVAYSDTSALREVRTMRSVQKVRLWQKFMLDGVEHLREVVGWERGQSSD